MGFGGGFVITVAVVAAFVVAISHCAVVRSEEETESTFQVNLDCYLDVLDSGFPHGCDLNSLMFKCHDAFGFDLLFQPFRCRRGSDSGDLPSSSP
jgi:hypothetical protein